MKPMHVLMAVVALTMGSLNSTPADEPLPEGGGNFPSAEAKASYALGVSIGQNLKQQGLTIVCDDFAAGLSDVLNGAPMRLTDAEIVAVLQELERTMRTRQMDRGRELAVTNAREGEAFLAENGKKKGVQTLPSGLQYKVVRQGKGAKPKGTDTVQTHYEGRLIDGTVFDSSYARGEPATFPVEGVIAGWTEALKLMPVGSKWQLYIPANLAYGERGAGQDIGPNATLVFDIELLGIE